MRAASQAPKKEKKDQKKTNKNRKKVFVDPGRHFPYIYIDVHDQEYLTRLRLKDRKHLNTPDGTVGPLERGLIKATNSGENFDGWVVGFYGEWSDKLTKLPETLADAQIAKWQSKYGKS